MQLIGSKICLYFIAFIASLFILSCHGISDDPIVSLSTGLISGRTVSFRGIKVNQFLSVPFAEPPLGDLRFAKPVPKKPWEGIVSANKLGPNCTQSRRPSTEDCLYLNVFVKSSLSNHTQHKKLHPVMVWIFGGAFTNGSANDFDNFDGTMLTALNDVIVVVPNYRLGPLGFLYLPEYGVPGNMGLWDQKLALEWVKNNINRFGGDPRKVTFFGQSSGGLSVSAFLVSPYSKGLFSRAIMQSGAFYTTKRLMDKTVPKRFLQKLNCTNPDQIRECLASYRFGVNSEADGLQFGATIDHMFLPDVPGNLINKRAVDPSIAIMLGTVGYEGAAIMAANINPVLFNPVNPQNLTLEQARQALNTRSEPYSLDYLMKLYFSEADPNNSTQLRLILAKAIGDVVITCPTYIFGRDLILNGQSSVYAYYLTQKPSKTIYNFPPPESTWLPPTHSDDVPFVFGYPFRENANVDQEKTIISSIMMRKWANFAKLGEPGSIGRHEWESWRSLNQNESKAISYPTIEFNSKRLGSVDSSQVQFCLDNWPFKKED